MRRTSRLMFCARPSRDLSRIFSGIFGPKDGTYELLQLPGINSPNRYKDIAKQVATYSNQLLNSLNPQDHPKHVVHTLDFISNLICKVADSAEFIRSVSHENKWANAADQAIIELQAAVNRINVHQDTFHVLKQTVKHPEFHSKLTHSEQKILTSFLDNMKRSGVHLEQPDKDLLIQLTDIEQQIAFEIGTGGSVDAINIKKFKENVPEIKVPASALPSLDQKFINALKKAPPEPTDNQVHYLIPADSMLCELFIAGSTDPSVRKLIADASAKTPAAIALNESLETLITVRQRIADFRGAGSWSEVEMAEGLFKKPEQAQKLLSRMLDSVKDGLESEMEEVYRVARDHKLIDPGSKLTASDLDVAMSTLLTLEHRKLVKEYEESKGMYETEYYPGTDVKVPFDRVLVSKVIDGWVKIFETMFKGLEIKKVDECDPGELWHWSVQKYEVVSTEGVVVGSFYLDLFTRPSKNVPTAQYTLRGSKSYDYIDKNGWHKTNDPLLTRWINQGVLLVEGHEHHRVIDDGDAVLMGRPRAEFIPYASRGFSAFQTPMTALVCSLNPSTEKGVQLMYGRKKGSTSMKDYSKMSSELLDNTSITLQEAQSIFHELGHVTHHLLSRTEMQHLSGTRGTTDFAEIPSHIFENFVSRGSKAIFGDGLSATNLKMPHGKVGHLEAAKQLVYGLVAQEAFGGRMKDGLVGGDLYGAVVGNVLGSIPSAGLVLSGAGQNLMELFCPRNLGSFTHLVHYGSTYYCYPFCQAVAAGNWEAFFGGELGKGQDIFSEEGCARVSAAGERLGEFLSEGSENVSWDNVERRLLLTGESGREGTVGSPEDIRLEPWLNRLKEQQ